MLTKHIADFLPRAIELRHHFHSKPELRYEEELTAELLFQTLQDLGIESIRTKIGGTGLCFTLDSGKPGKTVALRADMDALPIQELTGLPYQSKHPGKMHACGHDGHMATLLTCCYALKKMTGHFKGRIKFIFQPAEEGGAGAQAMIDDGVLDNPNVDAIFGYHNWPYRPIGMIGTRNQCIFASTNEFKLSIHGKGGHAAAPHRAVDPIYISSLIIQALQSIVSRLTAPTDPVVISVTQFHSGTTTNVIPDDAHLGGTIRTTNHETRKQVKELFTMTIDSITKLYGASFTLDFPDLYPPTINTPQETKLVLSTACELFGEKNVIDMPEPAMAAEDFSFFLQQVPGCYFLVGGGMPDAPLHNARFDFCDEILPTAAQLMCQVAMNYLNTSN